MSVASKPAVSVARKPPIMLQSWPGNKGICVCSERLRSFNVLLQCGNLIGSRDTFHFPTNKIKYKKEKEIKRVSC